MKISQKKELIAKGRKILEEGGFPEQILINLKEKRLREEISRAIFRAENGQKLDDLPLKEKKLRKIQLEVKRKFYEIQHGPVMIRRIASVLLVAGLIFLMTSSTLQQTNLVYGIIATFYSIILIGLAFSRDTLFSFLLPLGVIYTITLILELIILGIPDPLISNLSNEGLLQRRRGGSISLMFNQIVPFLFLTVKISAVGILFYLHKKKNNYFESKEKLKKYKSKVY